MRIACRYWYLSLLTVGVLSCSESTGPSPDLTLTGRWAGTEWLGNAEAFVVPGGTGPDTLYIFGFRPLGETQIPLETVRLRFAINGPGTYTLQEGDAELIVFLGGDVITALYQTTSTATGSVTLTAYSGTGALAEGTFSFDAQTTSPHASYGAQARFEAGKFRAVVQQFPCLAC